MIQYITKCDVCGDLANIVGRVSNSTEVSINTLDGHGDYTFSIRGGKYIDLCQQHKKEAFQLLTKLFGEPEVENEVV
jgi:hypothetical protein